MLELGKFQTQLTSSQIVGNLKAWPLNYFFLEYKIITGEEADKAARDFAAFIASAYRLWTRKIILLDLNTDLPSLKSLLKVSEM
jgi:hypothetical protein